MVRGLLVAWRSLLVVGPLLFAVPASAQVTLQLEPRYQRTFAPTKDLAAGDVVRLDITRGSKPERIRLHLCGPGCDTASTIQVWETQSFVRAGTASFRIERPGKYYLWVQDPDAKDVPLPLQSEQVGDALVLKYPSGLEIRARIAKP